MSITLCIGSNDSDILICPVCGENYLHHGDVHVWSRKEDAELGTYVVCGPNGKIYLNSNELMYECPSSRRDGITIIFTCEHCGPTQEYPLHIVQHKGNTHIYWDERVAQAIFKYNKKMSMLDSLKKKSQL